MRNELRRERCIISKAALIVVVLVLTGSLAPGCAQKEKRKESGTEPSPATTVHQEPFPTPETPPAAGEPTAPERGKEKAGTYGLSLALTGLLDYDAETLRSVQDHDDPARFGEDGAYGGFAFTFAKVKKLFAQPDAVVSAIRWSGGDDVEEADHLALAVKEAGVAGLADPFHTLPPSHREAFARRGVALAAGDGFADVGNEGVSAALMTANPPGRDAAKIQALIEAAKKLKSERDFVVLAMASGSEGVEDGLAKGLAEAGVDVFLEVDPAGIRGVEWTASGPSRALRLRSLGNLATGADGGFDREDASAKTPRDSALVRLYLRKTVGEDGSVRREIASTAVYPIWTVHSRTEEDGLSVRPVVVDDSMSYLSQMRRRGAFKPGSEEESAVRAYVRLLASRRLRVLEVLKPLSDEE